MLSAVDLDDWILSLLSQKLIMHFNWLGTTRCLAEQMGGCTSPRHEIVKAGIKKKGMCKRNGGYMYLVMLESNKYPKITLGPDKSESASCPGVHYRRHSLWDVLVSSSCFVPSLPERFQIAP